MLVTNVVLHMPIMHWIHMYRDHMVSMVTSISQQIQTGGTALGKAKKMQSIHFTYIFDII